MEKQNPQRNKKVHTHTHIHGKYIHGVFNCGFWEWEWMNENETYVYLAKCDLEIGIKCVNPIQFGNKEVGNENVGMRMKHKFTFLSF